MGEIVPYDGGGLPAPAEPARELSVEDYLNNAWDGLYGDDDGDVVRMPDRAPDSPPPETGKSSAPARRETPRQSQATPGSPRSVGEALRPLRAVMRQHGLNDAQAVSRFVEADQLLRADLVDGVEMVVNAYAAPIPPQRAVALIERIAQLSGMSVDRAAWDRAAASPEAQAGYNQLQVQVLTQRAQAKLDAFKSAEDRGGKPLYPDFARCRIKMAELMKAAREAGKTMTLEQAYRAAGGKMPPAPRRQEPGSDRPTTVEDDVRAALAQLGAA